LNGIQEFVEDDESDKDKTLANFLEEVALYTDDQKDKDPDRDCVSLMTIHASKGLEFPIVHLVGMEENLFPSQMALMNRQELEEERRLFYVAVTRAEKKLYLSFATSRFKYGSLIPCEPSRFIQEIDAKYLDMSLASLKGKSVYQRNADDDQFVMANKPTSNKNIFTTPKTAAPLPPEDPNFVPGDISNLKIGDMVQHQRFGRGVVTEMEGEGQNQKAKVNFDNIGTKTLVLKFAKMRIV
jgi:DNA helicase-2/ATP-dependent DNA helicase PcrA